MKGGHAPQLIDGASVLLEYGLVPWDTEILGFPVAQITRFELRTPQPGRDEIEEYEGWVGREKVRFVSCRLPHERLRESALLEDLGFRFVEMIYPMVHQDVASCEFAEEGICVEGANSGDLLSVQEIAGEVFATGRFHVDPQLGPQIGNVRYRTWIANSAREPAQEILKALWQDRLVGFFVVEDLGSGRCHWHLTAVARSFQGQGIGKKIWRAMMMHFKARGTSRIETIISARNAPVMNLYPQLGFRFGSPFMTFHWHLPC